MSYILEALKKSEQDRKKSDALSIYTVEHRTLPVEKRINIWAWFFAGLVLCNILWVALYFFVKQPEKPAATLTSSALQASSPEPSAQYPEPSAQSPEPSAQSPEPSAQSSGVRPLQKEAPLASTPLPRQAHNQVMTEKAIVKTYRDSHPQAERLGAPIYETIGPRKGALDVPVAPNEDFSADQFSAQAGNTQRNHTQRENTQRDKVFPSPYHLPPEVQQQLPSMRFDSHLYSEDADFRSVIVNGQLLHENDWVGDDLLLFKITELGVILRFGSYLFQMPIVEGWVNESQR